MTEIRIMMVDDHPIYRKGIVLTLMDVDDNLNIVCEAENVKDALAELQGNPHHVELVLLDLQLPDGNGIEIAQYVKQHFPDMKILVLSGEIRQGVLMPLVDMGVDGFLSKDAGPEELSEAIHSVMDGLRYYGKSLSTLIDNILVASPRHIKPLSNREREILKLVASGLSAHDIALKLNISSRTVESHKEHIFNKLGIRTTSELINYAFQIGLV